MNVKIRQVTNGVRSARRWMRGALDRVSGANSASQVFVPDYDGRRLRMALSEEEEISTVTLEESEMESGGAAVSAMLCRARERFGTRFFVSPEAIPPLCQRLENEYPEWADRLIEAVRTDAEAGIRIYSQRGPRIGADFPWDGLHQGPGDDGLYPKRPHRFAFAPRHALACRHDAEVVARLHGMLTSWMDRARSGGDRHCYDSNLVVIQRLLALSWSWVFLAGGCGRYARAEQQALEWTVLKIIEADVGFLEPRLGRSAPNNHLLADRFAAWYLRTMFPELLEAEGDGEEEARWRDELLRQTYPDGGSFEHSAHYHEFACEMGCAYLLLCRRQGLSPNSDVEARIEALLHFQAALTGPEASPIPFGNGIEDTLFPLDPDEGWCPGALRELYRALFRPEVKPTPTDNPSWVRAFWMLGGHLAETLMNPAAPPPMESFPDAGFYVMADADTETRLIFRTGPRPGVPVAPGHMHADYLSIFMSVAGFQLIVDPGTYTYRNSDVGSESSDRAWRQYFGGPRAHNGLVLDDRDPLGELTADFRRSGETVRAASAGHASPFLTMVQGKLLADKRYQNLRRTVVHVHSEYWLVIDILPSTEGLSELVKCGFQFDADTRVICRGKSIYVENPECPNVISLVPSPNWERPVVYRASADPVAGWISPRYGELRAAPQACFRSLDALEPKAFLVHVGDIDPMPVVDIVTSRDDGVELTVKFGRYTDIVLVSNANAHERRVAGHELQFCGELLWMRTTEETACEARWLGAKHLSLGEFSIESSDAGKSGRYQFSKVT